MSGFDVPKVGGFDAALFLRQQSRRMPPATETAQEPGASPALEKAPPAGPAFAGALADALDHVQSLQDEVRQKTRGLALGEDVEVHDVLLAANKSEVAFNLLLEVRNKLLDAWEKISRAAV